MSRLALEAQDAPENNIKTSRESTDALRLVRSHFFFALSASLSTLCHLSQRMVPLPPPPKPHVDPHALPALLDQRLLDEVLLPHCPRTVSNRTDEGATVCWTVELELWFQTFEPSVWQMLSEDEEADYKWLMAVTERCGLYDEELGKPVAEEAKLEGAQGEQFTIVRERYRQRFLRLQGAPFFSSPFEDTGLTCSLKLSLG